MLTIRQEISPNGKSGVFYDGWREVVEPSHCPCEEGAQVTDAAIHRVSADANGLSVRVMRASGSPRAFSPRDDNTLCHCEENRVDDAAIHRASGDVDGFVSSLTGSQ